MENIEKSLHINENIPIVYKKKGDTKNRIILYQDTLNIKEVCKVEDTFFTIADDIDSICLKNFSFTESICFICSSSTILIMEHCTFQKDVTFIGGTIILEAPQFDNCVGNYVLYNVKFVNNYQVRLGLNDRSPRNVQNNFYWLQNVNHLIVEGDALKSNIIAVGKEEFAMDSVHLKEVKEYYFGKLKAKNVKVEKSEILSLEQLSFENIEFINSTITLKEDILEKYSQENVKVVNSTFQTQTAEVVQMPVIPKNTREIFAKNKEHQFDFDLSSSFLREKKSITEKYKNSVYLKGGAPVFKQEESYAQKEYRKSTTTSTSATLRRIMMTKRI